MSDDDKKLYLAGKSLQRKADKMLAKDAIPWVEWRDLQRHALRMMRPRDCVRLIGI